MAARNSTWDDPAVAPKSARFAKFSSPGDTYAGTVTEIKVAVFDQGKDTEKSCPVLVLDTGQEVTCSASNLHRAVWELRPEIDDWISIQYVAEDEADYNRKLFDIRLVRAADRPPAPRDEDERLPVHEPLPVRDSKPAADPWAGPTDQDEDPPF